MFFREGPQHLKIRDAGTGSASDCDKVLLGAGHVECSGLGLSSLHLGFACFGASGCNWALGGFRPCGVQRAGP